MFRHLKKYFIFVGGAFILSLVLVLTFTTDREKDNSVKATAEVTYNQSTLSFIDTIGDTARQIGQDNNIYASVLIAQAILESNSGQSGLSQAPYYNYFGIKGSYNGSSVTMRTWEDDGNGNTYEVDQAFRSYGSLSDSLADYAALLSTNRYAGAWKSNTTSYADATQALTGTYATDSLYGSKLNSIIAYYGLTVYDSAPVVAEQPVVADDEKVWNSHRQAYTDAQTLEIDDAWANYRNRTAS